MIEQDGEIFCVRDEVRHVRTRLPQLRARVARDWGCENAARLRLSNLGHTGAWGHSLKKR